MNPTPETDARRIANERLPDIEALCDTLDLAKKLEQERDEARTELAIRNTISGGFEVKIMALRAEQSQLREVCDALATQALFMSRDHTWSPLTSDMNNGAIAQYKTLPHVKLRE